MGFSSKLPVSKALLAPLTPGLSGRYLIHPRGHVLNPLPLWRDRQKVWCPAHNEYHLTGEHADWICQSLLWECVYGGKPLGRRPPGAARSAPATCRRPRPPSPTTPGAHPKATTPEWQPGHRRLAAHHQHRRDCRRRRGTARQHPGPAGARRLPPALRGDEMPDPKPPTGWVASATWTCSGASVSSDAAPRRAALEARTVRREAARGGTRYCAFRAFAPGEQALAAKWAATFRQSELLLFDQTRRARWLIEAKDLDHPIAVLSCGVRREPPRT